MSKRDRAARAKNDGQSTAADSAAEELETRDDAVEDAILDILDQEWERPIGSDVGRISRYPAAADPFLTVAMAGEAQRLGIPHHVGVMASTDTFFEAAS